MKWYEKEGSGRDIGVSTRVRLARNFEDYPFEPRLNEAGAREIIRRVTEIFRDKDGYEIVDFASLSPAERQAMAEEHLVSTEFAAKTTPTSLIRNEEKGIYIMVLEEDHLRIQCILPGLDLDEAYRRAEEADALIDGAMRYAYSEKYGYLTHCPTNLGTGLRASVMLFLPAWTEAGGMRTLQTRLAKIGLTVRGMAGENSRGSGCLYQISNQVTLGISEEETIRKLNGVVGEIGGRERELRISMGEAFRDDLANRALRGIGMMVYSIRLTSQELMGLYRDVRLGAAMGLTGDVTPTAVDRLLFSTMPATLASALAGQDGRDTSAARDRLRAEKAKEYLK